MRRRRRHRTACRRRRPLCDHCLTACARLLPCLLARRPCLQANKVAQHLKKHKVTGTGYTNEDNPFGDANLDDRFV